MDIDEIVITGGPSGGKTTALAAVAAKCQELGRSPIIVPESATDLILSGLDPSRPEFQELVLRDTLHNANLRRLAIERTGIEKPVLIYDRGLQDGKAYTTEQHFSDMLTLVGLNEVEARDKYAGVIFLHSAANGAEEFYTTKNNAARSETLDQAREINQRTLAAWQGTPHFWPIENRPGQSFEQKIHECLKALTKILGEPEPYEIERKYLLEGFSIDMLPDWAASIDIRQTYLVGEPGTTERVRARGQKNQFLYYHTIKKPVAPGVVQELDRLISRGEYDRYLVRRDESRLPIDKQRHCFVHEGHYCELDVFHGSQEGLTMLEIEVPSLDTAISLPEFISAQGRPTSGCTATEVTNDPQYSNYRLAKTA